MLPGRFDAMLEIVSRRVTLTGGPVAIPADELRTDIRAALATRTRDDDDAPPRRGPVAVLPVYGILAHRLNVVSAMSGGTSSQLLAREIRAAVDDPKVDHLVLDLDSPGGSVAGMPELARAVREARQVKPITAVVNTLAASAAYWLAAGCTEIVSTPSGRTGSIGVFGVHVDASKRNEAEGLAYSLISAGRYKTEGNAFEPLTDEARAALQKSIDRVYAAFVADVAAGRNVSEAAVRGGYGEGRVLEAADALAAGLVDRVATFDDVLAELDAKAATRRLERSAAAGALDQGRRATIAHMRGFLDVVDARTL